MRVTAQDFFDYDKCPHRVYLNHHGGSTVKLAQSEFVSLLFEKALAHECEVVDELESKTPTGASLEERAATTLDLMRAGAERIYHGVLLLPNESGVPDLLEKITGQSIFGDFFYMPVDIKSGNGLDDRRAGTLRADYGKQLFHYGHLLSIIQGVFPLKGEILNKDRERVPYDLRQFGASYCFEKQEIEALISGTKTDEPALCTECGNCQWTDHCERALVETADVTLLADVGREMKTILNGAGIRTIQDVAKFDFSSVRLKGIGIKTTEKLKRSADAVMANKIQVLAKPSVPDPPRKIYLDFEDDPSQDLIYLCGMWVEPPIRDMSYHGLFCTDKLGEANIWKELLALCESLQAEDYVVFHFSSYEKTKLAALERKHGVSDTSALEHFKSRMVDLYPIVKKSVVLPARGYGLKKLAPFVGLQYSSENAGGAQSIVWFQKFQQNQNDIEAKSTLLQYNQEDCLAMKHVEEWLRKI